MRDEFRENCLEKTQPSYPEDNRAGEKTVFKFDFLVGET